MSMKDVKDRITNPKSKALSGDTAGAIRELAALLDETGLSEVEIEQNGQRLRVVRHPAAVFTQHGMAPIAVSAPTAATAESEAQREGPHPGTVTSPMVGTVYVAPEPAKPPFVKVGDTVKEGDTLLIVEAMKTMNPILAPQSGKILKIHVRDAEPVEFGQPLLIIG